MGMMLMRRRGSKELGTYLHGLLEHGPRHLRCLPSSQVDVNQSFRNERSVLSTAVHELLSHIRLGRNGSTTHTPIPPPLYVYDSTLCTRT